MATERRPTGRHPRVSLVSLLGALICGAVVACTAGLTGCATRQHLSPGMLGEVLRRDPELEQLRVYPSMAFVTFYDRKLGERLDVEGTQGAVETGYRGQRVELPFPRSLPGAIVALEVEDGVTVLWVTFDRRCREKACALGFVASADRKFRLHHVPPAAGFSAARVYRRRVAPRNLMQPSRIYAKSNAARAYMTTRGITASISLEIKKRDRVDIDTVVVPQRGVDAR
jgi:hypothetical protein